MSARTTAAASPGSASIRSQASASRTSGRPKKAASPAKRNGTLRSSRAAAVALAPSGAGDHADPLGRHLTGGEQLLDLARDRSCLGAVVLTAPEAHRLRGCAGRRCSTSAAPGCARRKASSAARRRRSAASPAPGRRRRRGSLVRQRIEHLPVRQAGILELVGHQVAKTTSHVLTDVGANAQQLAELEHQVAAVEAARLAEDPVVAGVEVRELDLALGAFALGCRAGGALERHGPLAQRGGRHRLRLEHVDATQQARQQPGGVAADLVPAKGKPSTRSSRIARRSAAPTVVKNGSRPALDRVIAQERLGGLLVGLDPELRVRAVEQDLGALAQERTGGPRPGEHEHALGRLAAGHERLQPPRQRLRAPRSGGAEDEKRPPRARRRRAGPRSGDSAPRVTV